MSTTDQIIGTRRKRSFRERNTSQRVANVKSQSSSAPPSKRARNTLTRENIRDIFWHSRILYATLRLDSRNEQLLRNLIKQQELKALDVQISQPVYNTPLFDSPVALNFAPPGFSSYQRVGNRMLLTSIRLLVLLEHPNLLIPSTLADLPMPNIMLRWALMYVRGSQAPLDGGRIFNYATTFRELDYAGNEITLDSLDPNPYVQDPLNAFASPLAGNSFQGYQERFAVLKEGLLYLSGVPSSANNSTNGKYVSNYEENADTRFTWNGPPLNDINLDLLDPDLLGLCNDGQPLTTTFNATKPFSGTYDDVDDGGLYFVYGTSYPAALQVQPSISIKSRVYFIDLE